MTTTTDQDGRAAKDAVLSALGRSGDQMARTLASCGDGTRSVPGMVWNVGDLSAHLVLTLRELTLALLGEQCAYDGATVAGTAAAVDNYLVAEFPVRDVVALAEMFDIERARFVAALAGTEPDLPVPAIAPNATALALGAIFVIDHHNHGTQLAEAGVRSWHLDVDDVRRCLAAVAPATYDRQAAAHMSWRFALHLRGAEPVALLVEHGALVVGDVTGPVDCHIVADPSAFLLESAGGFTSRPRMVFTGKLFAYGRRVWAILALPKLLPPVQHGGKILHGLARRREKIAARREVALRKVQRAERVSGTDSRATLVRPRVPQSESEQQG
jgi:hypothetical protein